MTTLVLIIVLLIMAAGLVGTFLPILPSIPLIYAGYFLYGLASDWKDYGAGVMIFLGLITVLVLVVDYLAGAAGAKKFGASSYGVIGSILGAIIGVIFFNLIGLVAGTFLGALVGELLLGRSMDEAVRSGWGAFIGFVAGTFFKLMTAMVMIVVFVGLIVI